MIRPAVAAPDLTLFGPGLPGSKKNRRFRSGSVYGVPSVTFVVNIFRLTLWSRQSLGWAERFGLLDRSPAKAARPPRPSRAEPKVVDPALAGRILRAAPDPPGAPRGL